MCGGDFCFELGNEPGEGKGGGGGEEKRGGGKHALIRRVSSFSVYTSTFTHCPGNQAAL